MTYLSLNSNSGRFARWLGKNLLAYVSGAVIFGIGFLVFATVYAYFVKEPAVIPTQPSTQTAPSAPAAPLEPSTQTAPNKIGPVATPRWELQLPVSFAKLSDQDLMGKKLFSPQGDFLGYIVSVDRDVRAKDILSAAHVSSASATHANKRKIADSMRATERFNEKGDKIAPSSCLPQRRGSYEVAGTVGRAAPPHLLPNCDWPVTGLPLR